MADAPQTTGWRRIIAAGSLWTVVYNLLWGAAWFAFMRDEWARAMAAIGRPVPFTAEVWFVWVVLTLPIGIAIMAYAAQHAHRQRRAIAAAAAVWLILTAGNVIAFSFQMSVANRVIALDSFVNLVAMIVAASAGAWSVDSR